MGLVKGLMECVCVCVRERVGEEFQVSNCNGLERKVCVTFGVLRIGNYCYNFQKPANRGLLRWKLWGKTGWVCVILLTWWVFIGLVGLGVWWSGDSGLVLSIHEASIFCDANWKFRFRGHFNWHCLFDTWEYGH